MTLEVVEDVQALVASPGRELSAVLGQDRSTSPASLASYFDPLNNDTANDSFDRLVLSTGFNDQLRIVSSNAGGYR